MELVPNHLERCTRADDEICCSSRRLNCTLVSPGQEGGAEPDASEAYSLPHVQLVVSAVLYR